MTAAVGSAGFGAGLGAGFGAGFGAFTGALGSVMRGSGAGEDAAAGVAVGGNGVGVAEVSDRGMRSDARAAAAWSRAARDGVGGSVLARCGSAAGASDARRAGSPGSRGSGLTALRFFEAGPIDTFDSSEPLSWGPLHSPLADAGCSSGVAWPGGMGAGVRSPRVPLRRRGASGGSRRAHVTQ
jgi:hypothetical protein